MSKSPELSEEGKREANEILELFKSELVEVARKSIGLLYGQMSLHIETDAWQNYRAELKEELKTELSQSAFVSGDSFWAIEIRAAIFKQFRAELEQGLIADLSGRVKFLEEFLADNRNYYR